MVKDIPADVAYIGGVWTEGVLYGIHIIVYFTLCYIFTSRAYTRGRETSSRVLLTYSTVMFALSTTHAGLAVRELLDGFVYALPSTPGGPPVYYRENVFPKRKAIYIFNTLLGDSLLVWRVFVIYGRSWAITAPNILLLIGTTITGLKTVAANVMSEHSSVFDPSILSWVTSTFVLTIATQLLATALIAYRIYAASRPFSYVPPSDGDDNVNGVNGKESPEDGGKPRKRREVTGGEVDRRQRRKYLGMVWLVVESGAVYTGAALVQLVTYLLNMNAGVIMEFMLAQLSAIIPMVIVVRVGLGLAYDGPSAYRPGYQPYTHRGQFLPHSNRNRNGYDKHAPSSSDEGGRGGRHMDKDRRGGGGGGDNKIYQLSTFQAAERTRTQELESGTVGSESQSQSQSESQSQSRTRVKSEGILSVDRGGEGEGERDGEKGPLAV